MREVFDPLYRLAGWFSEYTRKQGWFGKEFAPAAPEQLSASFALGFDIGAEAGATNYIQVSFDVGFDVEPETENTQLIAASFEVGFDLDADVTATAPDDGVVHVILDVTEAPDVASFQVTTQRVDPHPVFHRGSGINLVRKDTVHAKLVAVEAPDVARFEVTIVPGERVPPVPTPDPQPAPVIDVLAPPIAPEPLPAPAPVRVTASFRITEPADTFNASAKVIDRRAIDRAELELMTL